MRKMMMLFVSLIAFSAAASTQPVFDRYESVRQALLKSDMKSVQSSARELASAARSAKLEKVVTQANAVASAATIKDARVAFSKVSQEVIAYRDSVSGKRPVVLYCSMEKKSWLQPSASPIANPYLDATMRGCGEIVKR